jgi:hypothetical protein
MLHGCASQLDPDRVDVADSFYKAGTDTLINAIDELPNDCPVALFIGHARPSAPGVVYELTDPMSSTRRRVTSHRNPSSHQKQ